MRDLAMIIERMLQVIPPGHYSLGDRLAIIRDKARISAPEAQTFLWKEAQEILMSQVPAFEIQKGSWQEKVVAIWVGDRGGGVLMNPGAGG